MNLLQACIDVLFFHHPAAWWISRQLRDEREHCADDLAVKALEADRAGTRLSYARALPAAGLTAAALVAVVLSMATPRPAMADELPKDTNKIESLTPEQARKLVEKFEQVYLHLTA
jgi:beta-lactamase regulating signal transducer with metallopeptidase domain